jgi:maleylacetate reductase
VSRSETQAIAPFAYDALPGRVVFGAGSSRSELAGELERAGMARILVVASPRDASLVEELCSPFGDRVVARFDGVRQHVPVEVAAAARAAATGCDGVLAVGGGSAIGTAKAVALETGLPILAVPTTYAGSEMTPIWGLTEDGRKTTGRAPVVQPKAVVYDPELTLSLPPVIAAPSAMNALAHCVEALYAPGANPVCSALAIEGAAALRTGIRGVVTDPADLAARSQALYGAYLAGVCLAGAGTALHHKICHVLGGAFDLPHAPTHSAILPQVTAFLEPAAPELTRLRQALNAKGSVARAIYDLATEINAPTTLSDLFTQADVATAVDQITAANPPPRPRHPDRSDLEALLRAAIDGTPPS